MCVMHMQREVAIPLVEANTFVNPAYKVRRTPPPRTAAVDPGHSQNGARSQPAGGRSPRHRGARVPRVRHRPIELNDRPDLFCHFRHHTTPCRIDPCRLHSLRRPPCLCCGDPAGPDGEFQRGAATCQLLQELDGHQFIPLGRHHCRCRRCLRQSSSLARNSSRGSI